MKKTAVVYWSSTGNTEAMAQAVLEGMKEAGAEAVLLTPDAVDAGALAGMDAIAFGCPAMGSEVLEECEFEPMFSGCKNRLGGNECMERRYMDLCQSYRCRAKVFIKPVGGLKNKLGDPDLTIFFTSTMSHKMVQSALRELKSCDTVIERCHTSSLSALRNILEKHAG